jgi:phosphoglycerol transferase MdoB-like AlkP superfamily enzyme
LPFDLIHIFAFAVMKRNALHTTLSWIMLAAFVLVQLPFSAFHHHEHAAPCELVTGEAGENGHGKAHYSGYVLKKDGTAPFTTFVAEAQYIADIVFSIAEKVSYSVTEFHSSRAPPFIS